jgi:glycosyltransferase involved in cell wall biosynthesis
MAVSKKVDILVATHIAEAYGPQYVLQDYLQKQGRHFGIIRCPFEYAKISHAEVEWFDHGQRQGTAQGHANTAKGLVAWLRDAWLVWRWGWKLLGPESVFIGINNLHATVGTLLKWCGKGRCVVYYVIDYTPQRFANPLINGLYQRVARFAARHADMVWNLSERMAAVHRRFGAAAAGNILVPIGLDFEELQVVPEKDVDPMQWAIVSTLFESKGAQLGIEALALVPEAHLKIIGTGPYRSTLEKLAAERGVGSRVEFLGMASRRELYQCLARSRVALAPYQSDPANYSYYADPAKPKEYLACGVPTVITRVPWIAEAIEAGPMGLAIDYDAQQLATACWRLMTDHVLWRRCRENALAFTKDLAWNTIFDRAFAALKNG